MSRKRLTPIMTTEEAAKYLQMDVLTVRQLAREGTIPAIKLGRVWRLSQELLDRWLEEQSTQDTAG
jgi:PTS system nitrogen regulatory IIA component